MKVEIGCLPFILALAALFVGLKLAGAIAWSWIWVLAPLWVPGAGYLLAGLVAIVAALCIAVGIVWKEGSGK